MKAIQITEFGGPEKLVLADVPQPEPGDGEVLINVNRAGVNFADTHARENSYLAKYELPMIPGTEVAGTLEDGTRVVAMVMNGGYAEYAVAPKQLVVPVPDDLSDETALALLVQGLTAWHLYKTQGRVQEGESVVVISGAGGVGSMATQLGKPFGAGRVIATASSEEKRKLAIELGADAAVDPDSEDLKQALIDANEGKRVDVVFEMAGGRLFDQSLRALAPFGRLVAYGIASGEPNQLNQGVLMRRSNSVVGFWLMHCIGRPGMIEEPLRELFEMAARGEIRAVVGGTYALSDVQQAHKDIQSRKTSGKLVLDPSA
jgi:NADPH2:quinone reductase